MAVHPPEHRAARARQVDQRRHRALGREISIDIAVRQQHLRRRPRGFRGAERDRDRLVVDRVDRDRDGRRVAVDRPVVRDEREVVGAVEVRRRRVRDVRAGARERAVRRSAGDVVGQRVEVDVRGGQRDRLPRVLVRRHALAVGDRRVVLR